LAKSTALIVGIFFALSCIDKLEYDLIKNGSDGIVIDGSISNVDRPYVVEIKRTIPLGDLQKLYRPITGAEVAIFEDTGRSVRLTETQPGVYTSTNSNVIGQVGRSYWVNVKLVTGQVFQSIPDTIVRSPALDRIRKVYREVVDSDGKKQFYFDVFAKPKFERDAIKRLMWTFVGTHKVVTDPSCINVTRSGCNFNPAVAKCNFIPICSGLVNVGGTSINPPINPPRFERQSPCTCCTCWYKTFNDEIILSNLLTFSGEEVLVKSVPIDRYVFFSKLHVQVTQRGLSTQTFNFWRSIVSQKKGVKDLFQPAVGKVRGNLEQLSGNPVSVFGMFSAVSEQNASFYILQDDVPNFDLIPALAVEALCANCLELFPESTNVRPSFWVD
jgi:hypothetical protein